MFRDIEWRDTGNTPELRNEGGRSIPPVNSNTRHHITGAYYLKQWVLPHHAVSFYFVLANRANWRIVIPISELRKAKYSLQFVMLYGLKHVFFVFSGLCTRYIPLLGICSRAGFTRLVASVLMKPVQEVRGCSGKRGGALARILNLVLV